MAVINVASTDTFEQWRVKTNDLSTIIGDGGLLSGYTSSDVIGALNETKSNASFDNRVTISDQATDGTTELATNAANMIVTAGGQTVLTLNQTGTCSVDSDLSSGGALSGQNLTVTTTAAIGTNLTVTGTTTSGGQVIANGGIDCNGTADISQDLTVVGATTSGSLTVSGNATLGTTSTGALTVGGALNIGSNTVTTTGAMNVGTITSTGFANIQGDVTLGNTNSDVITPNGRFGAAIVPTSGSLDIGENHMRWSTVWANTFSGTATTAQYADLAELYLADQYYEFGTVVAVGGEEEVTAAQPETAHAVIGVVSERPAFLMNKDLENGIAIALKGRVPVKVKGSVNKGDQLVAGPDGHAVVDNDAVKAVGVALESFEAKKSGPGRFGLVEAVIL